MGYWENRRKREIIKHCPVCNSSKLEIYNGVAICKKCNYRWRKEI